MYSSTSRLNSPFLEPINREFVLFAGAGWKPQAEADPGKKTINKRKPPFVKVFVLFFRSIR
jgi:hypothetical protein